MSFKDRVSLLMALVLFHMTLAAPAHAYLDPGAGSYLIQILLAAIVGLGFLLKLYWRRLTAAIRRLLSRGKDAPGEKADD